MGISTNTFYDPNYDIVILDSGWTGSKDGPVQLAVPSRRFVSADSAIPPARLGPDSRGGSLSLLTDHQ